MTKTKILALTAVGIAGLAGACMFSMTVGVHIKDEPNIDFGDPPHREGTYGGGGYTNGFMTWRPGTVYLIDGPAEEVMDQRRDARAQNDTRARSRIALLEQAGRYREALDGYRDLWRRGRGDADFV